MPRVSKPAFLSVNLQPLHIEAKGSIVISAMVGFSLNELDIVLAEPDFWLSINPYLSKIETIDHGLPKPAGEWLLAGAAYVPDGEVLATWDASVTLGDSAKTLRVHGPRRWQEEALSKAAPVASVPMDWQFAWGGCEVAENTQGCGCRDAEEIRVPCIESPGSPWLNPDGENKANCTLPIEHDHPLRRDCSGVYTADYRERYHPGFPAGFDRRYFMRASADQRIEGYWRGDEEFQLTHWHPTHAKIAGRLPGWRATAHLARSGEGLCRVDMQLTTVWFFPEAMLGVLVFHGEHPINSLFGEEIERVIVGLEDISVEPLSIEHYETVWHRRTARTVESCQAAMDDSLLSPKDITVRFAAMDAAYARYDSLHPTLARMNSAMEKQWREAAARMRDQLQTQEAGTLVDYETMLPFEEMATRFERQADSIALLDRILKSGDKAAYRAERERQQIGDVTEMEAARKAAREFREEANRQIETLPPETRDALKHDQTAISAQPQATNIETIRTQLAELDALLTEPAPEGQEARWEKIKKYRARQESWFAAQAPEGEDGLQHMFNRMRVRQDGVSNIQAPSQRPTSVEIETTVEDAINNPKLPAFVPLVERYLTAGDQHWRRGKALTKWSESRLDLRGRDLRDLLLEDVLLIACDLRGARLNGSVLRNCELVGCDLENADLQGVRLEKTHVRECRLDGVKAMDSQWEGVIINATLGKAANFSRSQWTGCIWQGGSQELSCWEAATLTRLTIAKVDASGSRFTGVQAVQTSWMECGFADSDWQRANLHRCNFHGSVLAKEWRGARLSHLSMVDANFAGGNWQSTRFENVVVNGSHLHGCNFREVRWIGVHCRRADLQGADFSEADIENGQFTESDLRGTIFADARLSHCWLGLTRQDNATDFSGANTISTCFDPVLPKEAIV